MDLQERIERFVADGLPSGQAPRVEGLRRSAMGSAGASRENWLFDLVLANGTSVERRPCILRRDPTVSLLEAGLTTDRLTEYKLLKALETYPVRAPKAFWVDADGSKLERPSLIMQRMDGHATPSSTFPSYESSQLRDKIADQFVKLLVEIHRVDWRKAGLASFLREPKDVTEAALAQVDLWERVYVKDRSERVPVLDEAFRWLRERPPRGGLVTLVHGDYRSGNYLYDEQGTVHAVLDWELAHLGDPIEDVAWAGLKFWANSQGLASGLLPAETLYRTYQDLTGRTVDPARIRYYQVVGNVKMAVICLSGVKVFCSGKRAAAQLAVLGFLIPRLLEHLLVQMGGGE
ncbi:MAG: phosphotransferase family protein [Nitrospirae bacterium]|nr:phosphotransferase family protein [Nitrospirota bacterium]